MAEKTGAALLAAVLALSLVWLCGQTWQRSVRDATQRGVAYGMAQAQQEAYDRGFADGSEAAR